MHQRQYGVAASNCWIHKTDTSFCATMGRKTTPAPLAHRQTQIDKQRQRNTHTHTHLTALCPGLPTSAGTRMVKPIWILLKQETVSGSGISWAICKSASHSRQITMPAPHHSSFFYRPDALPAPNQQRQSTECKAQRQRNTHRNSQPSTEADVQAMPSTLDMKTTRPDWRGRRPAHTPTNHGSEMCNEGGDLHTHQPITAQRSLCVMWAETCTHTNQSRRFNIREKFLEIIMHGCSLPVYRLMSYDY